MKKRALLLAGLICLNSTAFIFADDEKSKEDLDKSLEENRKKQEDIADEIDGLNSKISDVESKIDENNEKIDAFKEEVEALNEEIENLEEKIEENEEKLGERLKVINENQSMGYLKVLLSSESISDLFSNMYMVKEVVKYDKDILKELDENKLELEAKNKQLSDKEKELELLNKTLKEDQSKLEDDKSELQELKSELRQEEEQLESEIQEILKQSQSVEEGAVISSGSWPVPGYGRISSPYGYRTHPVLGTQKMHTGIDIPAPTGTPVVSVDDGRVIFSGVQGSYGNTVMIQHDDGKVSLYAHNSALVASVGQRVSKGQVIAKIGSTGRSTGPHLHFEIRINGQHVNPVSYLN